ncbi:MAG TPA: MFS transporter [Thiothrix sp.]|nr:MFS transporter [Thiothrix sp.]
MDQPTTHRTEQAQTDNSSKSWRSSYLAFRHPRVITMLFLGLSAGIPILLIFSSLGLWLREAGVERSAVTFFSWAALGYSFKFVWAPLIDKLPVPVLTKRLGRRRAWILLSQFSIIAAILWMALTDPAAGELSLTFMAMAAVLLGFSSATQDIVIDAYRIESAKKDLQAMMSATYIAGYRIGMLVAGAGALYLASLFGTEKDAYVYSAWMWTYMIMAAVMLIGVATTLIIPEPAINREQTNDYSSRDHLGFLLLFVVAITGFITTFFISAELTEN